MIEAQLTPTQAWLVRFALRSHTAAVRKLIKASDGVAVGVAEAEAQLAVIEGVDSLPGILHQLAEWSLLPAGAQADVFGSGAGPWRAEFGEEGFRIVNASTREVFIVADEQAARTRASDLNQAHADRSEHDSRSWTGEAPE
jgi:hypothetical protein